MATALVLAIICLLAGWFYSNLLPAGKNRLIKYRVNQGDGVRKIAVDLLERGIVQSAFAFKLQAIFSGTAFKFKPGIYELDSNMPASKIARVLSKGRYRQKLVFIPKGATLADIDEILASEGIIFPNELLNFSLEKSNLKKKYPFLKQVNNLEGFLYPDTYYFRLDCSIEDVLRKFLDNFQDKVWPRISNRRDWFNILILASLLEKEVITLKDKKLVAGVLLNRLNQKIPLQVDATVVYIKCGKRFLTCQPDLLDLRKTDFQIKSLYNTYRNLGLPPFPIANFGLESLEAAISPIPNDYLYYLSAKGTKKTIFSKTLKQHNYNRYLYR